MKGAKLRELIPAGDGGTGCSGQICVAGSKIRRLPSSGINERAFEVVDRFEKPDEKD
ncbi:MAG: hypothetical protein WC406_12160 [Methanoregula sp.]